MTTYQVLHHVDRHVVLEMEAESVNDVPTTVTGDEKILDWAKGMVADGQSVYRIGAEHGAGLVTKDGRRVPQPLERTRTMEANPTGAPLAVSSSAAWVTVYDVDAAVCTITALPTEGGHWAELRRDDAISDPEDRFVVYVGGYQDVQVRFRLDEFGAPLALHADFDEILIGSPTIWPERLRQFVWWWPERSLWRGDRPMEWETHPGMRQNEMQESSPAPKKRVPRGNPGPRIR